MNPRTWSISTLLSSTVFGLTVLGVGLAFGMLATQRAAELEDELLSSAEAWAQTVGEYTLSSLAFDDPEDATEALGKLHSIASVEAAVLYDADGRVFAEYYRSGLPAWKVALREAPFSAVRGTHALVQRSLDHDGVHYGAIVLRTSLDTLAEKRRQFFAILGGLFTLVVLISAAIALLVHRSIALPIQHLSGVASRVAHGDAPPTEPGPRGTGEIVVLAESLERMFSELQRRAAALSESHATVRALIQSSPVAIVGTEESGAIALWSGEAERIFGRSAEYAVGRQVPDVLGGTDFGSLWLQNIETGEPIPDECTWDSDTRGKLTLQIAASSVTTDSTVTQRRSKATVVIVEDVTERRAAEASLAEKEHQLQQAQKEDVVGRLAAGVAHDFNNLLTVVTASSSLVEAIGESNADPELLELGTNMTEAAMRGAALTRRLLTFASPGKVNIEVIDLRTALQNFEPLLRGVTTAEVELVLDLGEVPVWVRADLGQLEQVLLNLVINSKDSMTGGGKILLEVSRRGGTAVVSCRDTGSGMHAETLARIFEPFFTTKKRGTGLGLATSREILRSFDGELECQSTEGVGTTMTLSLPVATPIDEAEQFSKVRPKRRRDATLVVVEDETAIRTLLRRVLRARGYEVIACAAGAEALSIIEKLGDRVHLLVTDVVMPGMSGPELAQRIGPIAAELPVLYLSGYAEDALQTHGIDPRSAHFLEKPFTPEGLVQKIEDVFRYEEARPARRVHNAHEGHD